jgi:MoaA/NifB/PqqE/SkfB family radical SAM enzyme
MKTVTSALSPSLKKTSVRIGAHIHRLLRGSAGDALLVEPLNWVEGQHIRFEAASKCQLKCPMCPTAKGLNKTGIVGWGTLKSEDFTALIDRNPQIKNIELSNWGEIFLNPQLTKILQSAFERNIALTVTNGVNLNTASDEVLEALVKFQIRHLSVSIDGASAETYKIYRVGGDFDKVISNVKKLNQFKQKHHSEFPRLQWQFIVFGHNEHEIALARELAANLKMDFYAKLSLDHWDAEPFSPVQNLEHVRKELGAASREEFRLQTKQEYMVPCFQFWTSPQINWDGKLLGCCDNVFGDFGNALQSDLSELLQGERFVYAKKMLLGQAQPRPDIPCTSCPIYKRRALPKALLSLPRRRRWLLKLLMSHS